MKHKIEVIKRRASGILLHISSLPSIYGIGDFGSKAFEFIDILKSSGQSFWQILPLNPTTIEKSNSPYASPSAFAGNALFINPEYLYKESLLKKEEIGYFKIFFKLPQEDKINYRQAIRGKNIILRTAFKNFKKLPSSSKLKTDFENFCLINGHKWLDDYCCFAAFKKYFFSRSSFRTWSQWPYPIKSRKAGEISLLKKVLNEKILSEKFVQFLFYRQWTWLKKYAGEKNIKIIGDIPIYVDYESSDVWANPGIFKLDSEYRPISVSGVPPDYYSKTGQLWKNPVYDWKKLEKEDFRWWITRIDYNLALYDALRIDHFRGFVSYWEVPAFEKTAKNGKWIKGRPEIFFNRMIEKLGKIPIIAESLGVITPDVEEVIKMFDFPEIRVLQFAFGNDFPNSVHLPINYKKNSVVYTGTHDNNTLLGWFKKEAKPLEIKNISNYLKKQINISNICSELIECAMSSKANLAIFPVQDILSLGHEARMNHPSTSRGNWKWMMKKKDFNNLRKDAFSELFSMGKKYRRIK